jgi:pimeloyl-ACP methyl ester carboxylesterase
MDPTASTLDHRGCPLFYRVAGDGPPVLLIQGVGLHGDGWRPQVDGLAGRYRCLTFDNRGLGRSQPTGVPVTVEQMTEDARVLMDTQNWESAHVVGHSLGGAVALHLALTARDRVRSLALLCTFASGRSVAPLSWRMAWAGLRMQLGTRRVRRRAFLELVMPPGALRGADRDALAASLAPVFGHDLGDQPAVVRDQLRAMRQYDATLRLGELGGVPTLVVSAEYDPIAPPGLGKALASGIPGARYVEESEASHGVTIHRRERINALLEEHFAKADAGGAGLSP